MMPRPASLPVLALGALLGAACAPTVKVATDKPIEININVNHELRIKVDDEVKDAIAGERQASRGVAPRGVEEDLAEVWESAGETQMLKERGAIGERANGYLGVVKPPNEKAQELVERANAARKAFYGRVARQNGTTLGDVEKLAGANRLADAAVGEWIQPPNGGWLLKDENTVVRIES